ncbi:MAG: STAS domain-containing protein [Arachidicoccus sp.]|nr:STAS domain-containing protein [Arachidicoccus sp.]
MFKVDTKEKFVIIRLPEGVFTVNVSAAFTTFVTNQLNQSVKNIIADFTDVSSVEEQSLPELSTLHQLVYKNNASFVLCNINDSVKKIFDDHDLSDVLNITPTESEAWDIVQMEEIEREIFGEEDI